MSVKKFELPKSTPTYWADSVLPVSKAWKTMSYMSGALIAADGQYAYYSTNSGVTWTNSNAVVNMGWSKVVPYMLDSFCRISSAGSLFSQFSMDKGVTWGTVAIPVVGDWRAIASDQNGVVCAAGYNSNKLLVSGVLMWTQETMPSSALWSTMAHGNSLFCALAEDSTTAATSADGTTWVARTLPISATWSCMTWGNGVFCALGKNSDIAIRSADGIAWSVFKLPTSKAWVDVAWNGHVFCAIAYGSDVIVTSPDGVYWTEGLMASVGNWIAITSDGTDFYAVCESSTKIAISLTPTGSSFSTKLESAVSVMASSPLGQFAPYASSPPDLAINISAGAIKDEFGIALGGTGTVIGAAQETNLALWSSPTIHNISAMPVQFGRIDRLYIDIFQGTLKRVVGVESLTPVAPSYPETAIPLCQVSLSVGQTAICNAHITDERGMVGNDSPVAGTGGVTTTFGNAVGYEVFDVPGTYSFYKPVEASFYRITAVGAGAGGGGQCDTSVSAFKAGGAGGGGATISGVVIVADDLTIVLGNAGVNGSSNSDYSGTNDAVNGTDGAATQITTSSGLVITANGGVHGIRGTPTTNGAGGAGGSATFGGFAGETGGSGTSNGAGNSALDAGGAGEGGMLREKWGTGGYNLSTIVPAYAKSGFVMVEWF